VSGSALLEIGGVGALPIVFGVAEGTTGVYGWGLLTFDLPQGGVAIKSGKSLCYALGLGAGQIQFVDAYGYLAPDL
jgi:hypothetical protein